MLDIAEGRSVLMKYAIAMAGISIAFSVIASDGASAEPVLMLNEPRDVAMAEYSCRWADDEIKADEYLIKSFKCSESELCQRALEINAACKVGGSVREVRAFHTKLLTQFASNPQCAITIMRLSDEKSQTAINNDLEAHKRANWQLNLDFIPGATKQAWTLWPYEPGKGISAARELEGEGDPGQIARDVCTIMTRSGAKILN
jgi:hypothetical protein